MNNLKSIKSAPLQQAEGLPLLAGEQPSEMNSNNNRKNKHNNNMKIEDINGRTHEHSFELTRRALHEVSTHWIKDEISFVEAIHGNHNVLVYNWNLEKGIFNAKGLRNIGREEDELSPVAFCSTNTVFYKNLGGECDNLEPEQEFSNSDFNLGFGYDNILLKSRIDKDPVEFVSAVLTLQMPVRSIVMSPIDRFEVLISTGCKTQEQWDHFVEEQESTFVELGASGSFRDSTSDMSVPSICLADPLGSWMLLYLNPNADGTSILDQIGSNPADCLIEDVK